MITEAELKKMEAYCRGAEARGDYVGYAPRLIVEVRRLREALEHYGTVGLWDQVYVDIKDRSYFAFEPIRPDLRYEPGYKLARITLGWPYPPPAPCDNPSCDGVEGQVNYGEKHRCFKDGRWLDDGSEM